MPTKSNHNELSIPESSIFDLFESDFTPELENKEIIIDSQFSIYSQTIQLQLYPKMLKLTFLSPKDENSTKPLFLKLDHSVKAAEIQQKVDGSIVKKIGISIFKDHDTPYNFFTPYEEIVNRWMHELSKMVFLSGFSTHFKPVKYIGRGEFAQVWEVERIKDGSKFAAKIIDKDVCFGQVNGREGLYNEIQILKKLNHPNIVHLECIYQSQKSIYIIQEYIEGQLFSDLLKKRKEASESSHTGRLEKQQNTKIMKNLLKAVQYLHQLGIAHRDLKPGNIIIHTDSWMPCIIDFGLSEFSDKSQYLFQCCGSPGYMAPEIFKEQKVEDLKKCDIFSLGALFYMLLTHQPLFMGNSSNEIIQQTKNSKKIIKKKVNSNLQQPEANLILSMLDENPSKRITAEEALNHEYFLEAIYDYLQEIRKPTSEGTGKYSLEAKNLTSKFEQLFSESIVVVSSDIFFSKEFDKENINSNQSDLEPSTEYIQNIKSRRRFLSEENIETEAKVQQKVAKMSWSGKWKNFNTLEKLLRTGNFWPVKDLNLF